MSEFTNLQELTQSKKGMLLWSLHQYRTQRQEQQGQTKLGQFGWKVTDNIKEN